jgi:hypothetical protein
MGRVSRRDNYEHDGFLQLLKGLQIYTTNEIEDKGPLAQLVEAAGPIETRR